MAKTTAKKSVKLSLNQLGETPLLHIKSFFVKVKLFHGLQLVKWVLEVLKKATLKLKWQKILRKRTGGRKS
jgi:hypothetical protein